MTDEIDLLGLSLTGEDLFVLAFRAFAAAVLLASQVALLRRARRAGCGVVAVEIGYVVYAILHPTASPVADAVLTGAWIGGVSWIGLVVATRDAAARVLGAVVLPALGAIVFLSGPLSPMPGQRCFLPSAARCLAALDRAASPDPQLYIGEESYELVTVDGARYLFAIIERTPYDYSAILCGRKKTDRLDAGLLAPARRLHGEASPLAERLMLGTRFPELGASRRRSAWSYGIRRSEEEDPGRR